MKMIKPLSTTLLLVVIAGCVSARAVYLGPERYPEVPPTEVRVFMQASEVPATCTRFAVLEMQGSADATSRSALINAARTRAGKIGANAILLPEMREPSTGTRIAGALIGIGANRKGQSTAYRCEQPASPPNPAGS